MAEVADPSTQSSTKPKRQRQSKKIEPGEKGPVTDERKVTSEIAARVATETAERVTREIIAKSVKEEKGWFSRKTKWVLGAVGIAAITVAGIFVWNRTNGETPETPENPL